MPLRLTGTFTVDRAVRIPSNVAIGGHAATFQFTKAGRIRNKTNGGGGGYTHAGGFVWDGGTFVGAANGVFTISDSPGFTIKNTVQYAYADAGDDGHSIEVNASGGPHMPGTYTVHTAWSADIGGPNDTLSLHGAVLLASSRDEVQLWDVEKRERTANLRLPKDDGPVLRHALSRAGDRFFLPSGRIATVADGKVVSNGPGLGRRGQGYAGGCWGPGDRFVALVAGESIVLHRLADGATLVLYQFVVGSGVEVLAMTPSGAFDGSDALLETVWFNDGGTPRRAISFPESRRRGLLERFHEGR